MVKSDDRLINSYIFNSFIFSFHMKGIGFYEETI